MMEMLLPLILLIGGPLLIGYLAYRAVIGIIREVKKKD